MTKPQNLILLGIKLLFVFLFIYSLVILYIEIQRGQDFVRLFLTDIKGPVKFYAINTSLSVFFLWASALMFFVNLSITEIKKNVNKEQVFYISQIIIFLYMGADDRFLIHEWLSYKLSIHDAIIFLVFGFIELLFLLLYGEIQSQSKLEKRYLFLVALFFSIMIFIEAFAANKLFLRLSVEDISKVWATFFIFMFSWERFQTNINQLKDNKNNLG